jgi:UDP-GlcNAc:undecaprenyl-phosphate GlcNAc-1-phosphate transferase
MSITFLDAGLFFLYSFGLSAFLTPCVIWISRRTGFMAQPREDRWHRHPTALLGGIALFLSFMLPNLFLREISSPMLILTLGASAMFLLGLIDDLHELSPQSKFIGQLIISALIVAGGVRIQGLSPAVSIIVTLFWFVAITNAVNILDNMDGLAAGISFIAACSLWVYSQLGGPILLGLPAMLLAGATAGFWIYNFNPAKIFMGDCGSLFLGFLLAGLTVKGTWTSGLPDPAGGGYTGVTSLVLVLVVPVAVLIIPLFDTALVSFTRVQTGRPISKGGRDHTSHRMVLLGYSEKRTVLTLMAWAGGISALALYLSYQSAQGLLVMLSVVAVISLFFGTFLTHLNGTVYDGKARDSDTIFRRSSLLSRVLNKKQILQAVVDTVLITIAYLTSYLLRYDGVINLWNQQLIEKSLPLLIPIKLCCFWMFGLYRGQWRYVSIGDMWQIFKAVVVSSVIIVGLLLYIYRFDGYSRVLFVNDALLTLIMIGGVRLLMRLFKEYFNLQAERSNSIPILIVGAGDGGDLFLRELRHNSNHDYLPVGFIDDDPAKKNQIIHGIKVLGAREDIPAVVKRYGVKRVFVSIMSAADSQIEGISDICEKNGVKCDRVRPLLPIVKSIEKKPAYSKKDKVVPFRSRMRKNERKASF